MTLLGQCEDEVDRLREQLAAAVELAEAVERHFNLPGPVDERMLALVAAFRAAGHPSEDE